MKNIASAARSGRFARSSITSTFSSTPCRSAISPVKSHRPLQDRHETDEASASSKPSGSAPKDSS